MFISSEYFISYVYIYFFFFFLIIRRPPRSTLFPSTPLFRSVTPTGSLNVIVTWMPWPALYEPLAFVELTFVTVGAVTDRKSTRLNSSHSQISYAVFCLKKKKKKEQQ